jgi:glyoxylate reductase
MVGDAVERLEQDFDVEYRKSPYPASNNEFNAGARNAEAIISFLDDNVDQTFIQSAKELKVIAQVAVGFDNIDVAAATERAILVTNTPGVLTNATADLAFALLISVARRIVEADRYVREGYWQGWSADLLLGHELHGKTLGIVGMGRIGEAVAKRALAFGMKIIYTRRTGESSDPTLVANNAARVELDELLTRSDFISLHCPANAETKNMIGSVQFNKMKPTCFLINTARGAIVDQTALVDALRSGKIAGAGLDVFAAEPEVPNELKKMRNVVLAPHMGSATIDTRAAMSALAVDAIISAFSGKLPGNAVNPEVWNSSPLNKAGHTA